jgi:hypothetical protein
MDWPAARPSYRSGTTRTFKPAPRAWRAISFTRCLSLGTLMKTSSINCARAIDSRSVAAPRMKPSSIFWAAFGPAHISPIDVAFEDVSDLGVLFEVPSQLRALRAATDNQDVSLFRQAGNRLRANEQAPCRERGPTGGDSPAERLERYMVHSFAAKSNKQIRGLTRRVQALLSRYSWPGNIRELENVIGHACIMTEADIIDIRNLPDHLRGGQNCANLSPGKRRDNSARRNSAALHSQSGKSAAKQGSSCRSLGNQPDQAVPSPSRGVRREVRKGRAEKYSKS